MNIGERKLPKLSWAGGVAAAIVLALTLALLALDGRAAAAWLLGLLVALPLYRFLRVLKWRPGHAWIGKTYRLVFFMSLALVAIILIAITLQEAQVSPQPPSVGVGTAIDLLTQEENRLQTADNSLKTFLLQRTLVIERVRCPAGAGSCEVLETKTIRLPEETVPSSKKGFLLQEVVLPAARIDEEGVAHYPNGADGMLQVQTCRSRCPRPETETFVEVRDLPKNSFFAAKEAVDLVKTVYVDVESVHWKGAGLNRPDQFVVIAPPYTHFLPVLKPLIGLSKMEEWVAGVGGLVVGIILLPVLQNLITDLFKEAWKRMRKRKPRLPRGEPPKQA